MTKLLTLPVIAVCAEKERMKVGSFSFLKMYCLLLCCVTLCSAFQVPCKQIKRTCKSHQIYFIDEKYSTIVKTVISAAISIGMTTSNPDRTLAAVLPTIAQGAIDIEGVRKQPGSSLIIQIFSDETTTTTALPLAGAKVNVDRIGDERFIFQLFKENLLIPESKWKSLGDFDQTVTVKLCENIDRYDCTSGSTIAQGQATARLVNIPRQTGEGSQDRKIRLLPFVKLTVK